jgi:transposase
MGGLSLIVWGLHPLGDFKVFQICFLHFILTFWIFHNASNDHGRRYFFSAQEHELGKKALETYDQIYAIETKVQQLVKQPKYEQPQNSAEALKLRQTADPLFEKIYDLSCEILLDHAPGTSVGQAANYFLNNLTGLTRFLTDLDIPISNAPAERSVRNPAVGRKTWLGTHSRKGAETSAILFSIFESCRLNQLNPREYCHHVAELYRTGQPLITPFQFKQLKKPKPPP